MWSKCPCVIQWVLIIYFITNSVHILVWSNSFLHAPYLYILVIRSFFLSLWGSVSGQEVPWYPSLVSSSSRGDIIWYWYLSLSVSLTSHDHLYFLSCASLGIISCFLCGWEILHYVHVPHSLYQFNCASTISLIPSLSYFTLQGQNHRVTHLFF